MPNKAKVYLAIAAVVAAVAVPAGFLSTRSAGASTTACGSACTSPSVESLGTGEVLAVSGNSVVMAAASASNSGEDWTPEQEGAVSNAVSAGIVSAKLNFQYSNAQLVEFQYAPNGVPSDKCLANTATEPSNAPPYYWVPTLTVVLAPCGMTAQSLWILDAGSEGNGFVDLINAGYEAVYTYLAPAPQAGVSNTLTSPFAEPTVLTVNSSGNVVLAPLSELGGVVSQTQLWANWSSPAQAALRTKVAKSR